MARSITVHDVYELVINANGPIRFELGCNTYWLSHHGRYNGLDHFPRHPSPDRESPA